VPTSKSAKSFICDEYETRGTAICTQTLLMNGIFHGCPKRAGRLKGHAAGAFWIDREPEAMARGLQSSDAIALGRCLCAGNVGIPKQEYVMTQNNPQKQNQQKQQDQQARPGQQNQGGQNDNRQGQQQKSPGQQQGQQGDGGESKRPGQQQQGGQGTDGNRNDGKRSGQQNSKDDERGEPGTQRPGQGGTDRS
jgi:hypothetical protein